MRTIRIAALAVSAAALAGALAVPAAQAAPAAQPTRLGQCGAGQLCLWTGAGFRGARGVAELSSTDIESCVTLPKDAPVASLANRMGRPVTTYQSATCGETGEFDTYPSGTWVPETSYRVRAFKIWES
ncbi:peptidase inhibitor family I36 protein [Streptomyces sp. NPDC046215]|uniref:Proteinase inhibitor I36 SMPI n=1 Tax=Streptomyces stramineus TaxID=173861 RepID=A0ABN0ZUC6_9ACTN